MVPGVGPIGPPERSEAARGRAVPDPDKGPFEAGKIIAQLQRRVFVLEKRGRLGGEHEDAERGQPPSPDVVGAGSEGARGHPLSQFSLGFDNGEQEIPGPARSSGQSSSAAITCRFAAARSPAKSWL